MTVEKNIRNLSSIVEKLEKSERRLFNSIFEIRYEGIGRQKVPDEIKKRFGGKEGLEAQEIVRIANKISSEESRFNYFRSLYLKDLLKKHPRTPEECTQDCIFNPAYIYERTPEDPWGRLKNDTCITASNLFKYTPYHGLVIPNVHDILFVKEKHVYDAIELAEEWLKKANEFDERAIYPNIGLNYGKMAGASQSHLHFQVFATRFPEKKVFEAAKYSYRYSSRLSNKFKRFLNKNEFNYWEDLYNLHEIIGLGFSSGSAKIMAYLAPQEDKGILAIANSLEDLKLPLYKIIECYRNINTFDFNVGIWMPPLKDNRKEWKNFPYILRSNRASTGMMEKYFTSIVATDPFELIKELRRCFNGN